MINITEGAVQAINGLVSDRPDAGLRIFSRPSDGREMQVALSIADRPEPTDEVVEQSGCQVFLDETVAPLVDGRTLDATPTDDQRVQFSFVA